MQKKLELLGWLKSDLDKRGKTSVPVLAGMSAVEYFTNGAYTSQDIDILWSDTDILTEILAARGFLREGRFWYNEDENIVLEVLGHSQGRNITSVITEYGTVNILAVEEVILDLLEGYVWAGSRDDYQWARVLLKSALKNGTPIDMDYLRSEAQTRDIIELLDILLSEVEDADPL